AIAYLGTWLHNRGFSFDYINSFQEEKETLAEKLESENILSIAIITTLYVSILPILEIVEFIKKHNPNVKIILGGPFVANQIHTLEPEPLDFTFKSIGADYYVNSSQGETALTKILETLKTDSPHHELRNVYYREGDNYISTPLEKENNSLSDNMVNWDLFAPRVGEYVNIRTSISCPFSCKFCGFPEHAGEYRTASLDAVETELDKLARIPSIKSLQFIDDTLNIPQKRFKELLRLMIKKQYNFRWHSHYRCQFADRETVELMKESGCEGVFLGIESGSNSVLGHMSKAATVEKYLEGIALLKEYDLITYGSFIIGFPGETEETAAESLQFIKTSGIDFFRAQLWYCDPFTPIWKEKDTYQIEGSNFEWKHAGMDSQTAGNIIDNIFQTVQDPIWVPQYNFECDGIFHLLHRGVSMKQVKNFLRAFNNGVREKLLDPSRKDTGFDVLKQLKTSCIEPKLIEPGETGPVETQGDYDADFDF
ncbi:MAG: radical SAM protein, partial [bacterium]|nr:radical SAM protein [bacterium]